MPNRPFIFLTVTWAADIEHFAMLRASLRHSRLAHIPHHVVVQDEDLPQFQKFAEDGVFLHSSADVLPKEVEARRKSALVWQRRFGRRAAKLGGSLTRHLGWPRWVRYTGWHTQQLSKLAFVRESAVETVVILDSDVLVTPHAREEDFLSPGKAVCYELWRSAEELGGKVANWQQTAKQLLRAADSSGAQFDAYYDTPFVMHAPFVQQLSQHLEQVYSKHWWQVLVELPPRRWSEFGIYKQFLRERVTDDVDWREANIFGYIFDASDERTLMEQFEHLVVEQKMHFVTVHSQNSGRQRWRSDAHINVLIERLAQLART